MDFLLSPEIVTFQESLRKFLADELPWESIVAPVEGTTNTAHVPRGSTALYLQLVELGLTVAPLSEAAGGLGLGLLSVVAMMEELGRALVPVPIVETVALGICPLLQLTLTPEVRAALDEVHSGGARCSGALVGELDGEQLTLAPTETAGRLTISGAASLVPAAASAKYLFLVGDLGGRSTLVLVDRSALPDESFVITETPTLDLGRAFSRIAFCKAEAMVVGELPGLGSGELALPTMLESRLAFAAELSGIALRVVGVTVDYVKDRHQFGRPIGSFQAIQHALTDMHVATEQLRALVRFAAWCGDVDRSQFGDTALAACAFAAKEVPVLVEKSIQLHGGIGFTYEYPLHAFLRRALVTAQLIGGADQNAQLLAKRFVA